MTVVAAGSDCRISAPTVFPVVLVLVLGIVLPFLFVRITILILESAAACSSLDVKPGVSLEEKKLPKGETWSVHKFGGTCVGTSQRIKNVADIILKDDSGRKLVVVSAMSKCWSVASIHFFSLKWFEV
ncbi:bifunctional aspartokinase/homoserine dehydrogenase 2, chloroplastic isoform X2 [Glycine max]|uniref:bifunctional aspartokinase/homoserine dehydrogenase 2, chloroplastic isoform X2 n=1 Tax=Glycine max TaxID=3847 RepID=UPI001B3580B5|nr:bifunctional aspartokinase/homoserine dehydrogenase 2, chloroplastic-like isoform X2 [Glycine max]